MARAMASRCFWHAPQNGKDTQIFRSGQIGIKAGGLDQAADAGQDLLFIPLQRISPDPHLAGRGLRQSQQHFHGGRFSGPVPPQQTIDPPALHMDT